MIQALFLTAAVVLGQQDAAADLSFRVQQLVRQLEADERLKRDEAQQRLVELGPAILDQLVPLIERAKTADVKHRLELVQAQLESQNAQDFAKARTLSLSGEMPLSQVVAEITKQTGNKILDHRAAFQQEAPDPKLKVDFDKTPFWQALDRTLDLANLTLYNYAGKDGLAMVTRSDAESPRESRASYAGAFRLEAMKIVGERDFQRPGHPMLQVTLEAAWEPRFTPIMIVQSQGQIKGVDDKGNVLQVENPRVELEIPIQGPQTAVEFPVSFALPPRSIEKIATLSGKLTAVVPSRIETFQFDDIADKKNVDERKAGVTVTLEQVRKNQDVWEVRIRIRFDEAFSTLESHRGWIFENEAYLLGPDGKRIENAGLEKTRQGSNEVGLAYLFTLPGGPAGCSFVYKSPAAILKLPIEYTIKDVKLP